MKKRVIKRKKFEININDIISLAFIIIIVVFVRVFIATPVNVHGGSMEPTLLGTETMLLNKFDLVFNDIERYDVVVIKTENKKLIKRVIGLPSEVIECSEGNIYINGKIIKDDYGIGKTTDFSKIKLSENEYFVLGDNREISKDSRIIGPIKREKILGTTKIVIFPFNKLKIIK